MPFSNSILGHAKLSSSSQTIYTVPSGTTCRISHIIIAAVTTGKVTLQIEDSSTNNDYLILPAKEVPGGDILEVFDIILNSEDGIKGSATDSTDIEITLFGIEQT